MKLTVYHLKNCDTCKKSIKALEASGHELTLIDVRADGVSKNDLEKFMMGVGIEALLNTRSTTWRELDDRYKSDMSEAKALSLMGEHPTLIKRPVISDANQITVGWNKEVQTRWLT
ncbi:MAG: Spx/MgsR family RNA polymerase-binding regulatory protein [Salaquimonas sp.]